MFAHGLKLLVNTRFLRGVHARPALSLRGPVPIPPHCMDSFLSCPHMVPL